MRKGLGRHNYRSAGGPQPSLVLDFAGTGTLDPRVTFTRSTTGTYYNSSGVLSTAAINAPRFDYNPSTLAPLGLLIEQSSTNLLTYSQDFSNAVWNKTVTLGGTTTAPDGTNTGQLIYPSVSGAFRVAYQVTAGLTLGKYTWTVYGKAQNKSWLYFNPPGGGTVNIYFNLSTNQVGTIASGYTASIQDVGNGWRRCVVTDTTNQTYSFGAIIGVCDADNSGTATKNGTDGIYIWGSQTENLTFPTSYIPTTSAQVTRASDNASMTGTNFSSWYNQSQGTLYAESSTADTFPTAFAVGDTTANNRIQVGLCPIAGLGLRSYVITNGVQQNNVTVGNYTLRSFAKIALSCISGAFTGAFNGTASSTATGNMPVCTQATIGQANYTGQYQNGTFKKIAYYPVTLTNAQLQSLTGS